jgi:hypothetical protein
MSRPTLNLSRKGGKASGRVHSAGRCASACLRPALSHVERVSLRVCVRAAQHMPVCQGGVLRTAPVPPCMTCAQMCSGTAEEM